jgi:hypothetical protein
MRRSSCADLVGGRPVVRGGAAALVDRALIAAVGCMRTFSIDRAG